MSQSDGISPRVGGNGRLADGEDWLLVRHLGDGVAVIDVGGDTAMWTRGKLRKVAQCAVTGETLHVGDLAYRPLGNQNYRWKRIAAEIIDVTPIEGWA